jgi:hypothetical protein
MEAIEDYLDNFEKNGGGDATVCPEFIATYEISMMPDKEAKIAKAQEMAADQLRTPQSTMSKELPEQRKMDWWRWPLVPIGSIAGAVGGAILMTALQWLAMKIEGRISEDGWWARFVQPLMVSGVFGYLWSTLAYSIAPKGKLIAAVVMTTLLGVLWCATIIIVINDSNFPIFNKVYASISVVTSMIAAICGVVSKHSE